MSIIKKRNNLQNPSVPVSAANILEQLGIGGQSSAAGTRVTERKALTLSPVWQCVNMISGDVAKLPLEVFQRTGPKQREKDKQHQRAPTSMPCLSINSAIRCLI